MEGTSVQKATATSSMQRPKPTKPILFIIDASKDRTHGADIKRKLDDLPNAKDTFIKHWILNHICCVFVRKKGDTDVTPLRTDYEGCLVFEHPNLAEGKDPWKGLYRQEKGKLNQYHFFFSTIDLDTAEAKALFDKYKFPRSDDGIALSETPIKLNRPYHPLTGDYHVVRVPLDELTLKSEFGLLEFWESVIFHNSEHPDVVAVRDKFKNNGATQRDFDKLRGKVEEIRGDHLIGYTSDVLQLYGVVFWDGEIKYVSKPPQSPPLGDLPFLLDGDAHLAYPRPQSRSGVLSPDAREQAGQGPFWLESEYRNTEEEAEGGGLSKKKSHKEVHLYDMLARVREGLPFADPASAITVTDDKLFEKLRNPVLSAEWRQDRYSDQKVRRIVGSLLGENELARSFFVGYGNDWNSSLLNALDDAALYWKHRILSSFDDVAKDGAPDKRFDLATYTKVSFDTKTDAFSESVAPAHVYTQLSYWWSQLSVEERSTFLNCDYVTVEGHTSEAGGPTINVSLAEERAWKTAGSLWLLLENEYWQKPWKKRMLFPEKNQPLSAHPPTQRGQVPIFYSGIPGPPSTSLLVPYASTRMPLTQDDKLVQDAIANHRPNDEPEHRIAIIGFHQLLPPYTEQMLSETIRVVTATPIVGYRVVLFDQPNEKVRPCRMLVYVRSPLWK
jgi:hypothetical protein